MKETWQQRISAGMAEQGRSALSVSHDAGLGKNFGGQILNEGKDPSLSNFLKLCAALQVSPAYILFGTEITAEDHEFLNLLAQLPGDFRQDVLDLVKRRVALDALQ